jgi:hypothetical protein
MEITAHSCRHPDGSGRRIVFLDTPGFDNSDITDCEVLKSIADWLTET